MRKKVLLVEDNFETLAIYKRSLEKEGLEIISVALGDEAVLAAKAQKPNLIILDLMLPGSTSGVEVLEQIKSEKSLKNIPILVITNLHTQEEQTRDLGASQYLVKANSSLTEVVSIVRKYLKD